jgi:putative iron-only hydrogenase system regulator
LALTKDGFFIYGTKSTYRDISIYDRDVAFRPVGELLHQFGAENFTAGGYPMPDRNVAVIFLILKMTTDELGALTGKLGQIPSVNVKANTLKV